MKSKLLCALLCLAFSWAQGQEIEWNRSFGTGGMLRLAPRDPGNAFYETTESVVGLENGKVLVAVRTNGTYLQRLKPDGTVDDSFGTKGKSRSYSIHNSKLIKAPDGNIIFAGFTYTTPKQLRLYRLKLDGTPDLSFGNNGEVAVNFMGGTAVSMNAAYQKDGKLVMLIGPLYHHAYDKTNLLRFDGAGNLDTTFSDDGTLEVAMDNDARPFGMALSESGISVGIIENNALSVAGFTLEGRKDMKFGESGWRKSIMPFIYNGAFIAQKPDGNIIIGTATSNNFDLRLCQLLPNGKTDASYSKSGFNTVRMPLRSNVVESILIDNAGGTFITTHYYDNSYGFATYKLKKDGTLDSSYGIHGIASRSNIEGNVYNKGSHLFPDGSIGMFGEIYDLKSDYFVAKFDVEGQPEQRFGSAGIIRSFIPGFYANFQSMIPSADGTIWSHYNAEGANAERGIKHLKGNGDPDVNFADSGFVASAAFRYDTLSRGRIITAEQENSGSGVNQKEVLLTRFLASGQPDITFGPGGIKRVKLLEGFNISKFKTLPDDKMLILCSIVNFSANYFITRLNSDGTLDQSFGINGYVLLDDQQRLYIEALTILSDGSILLGGSILTVPPENTPAFLMKLLPNGNKDQNFGNGGFARLDLGPNTVIMNVKVQPTGKLVASVGYTPDNINYISVLMRFDEKGAVLNDFGTNGKLGQDQGTLLVLNDGRLLRISIEKDAYAGKLKLLMRLPDGQLDSHFGDRGSAYLLTPSRVTDLLEAVQQNNNIYIAGSDVDELNISAVIAAFQLKQTSPVVSSFTLINATSDKDIQKLKDSTVINLAEIKGKSINIRANTEGKVGSVLMQLSGAQQHEQLESIPLYALYGNTDINYRHWRPTSGSYTLEAIPYALAKGKGEKGASHNINFKIIDSLTLSGLTLINAKTNKPIGPVQDDMVIDLAVTPYINFRANAGVGIVESVRFGVNGDSSYRTESILPFALAADNNGKYYSWQVTPGTYTITATPYSKNGAKGKPGQPVTLTIKIIHTGVQAPAIVQSQMEMPKASLGTGLFIGAYPNPATTETYVQYRVAKTTMVSITLVDLKGNAVKQVYQGSAAGGVNNRMVLPLSKLAPGVYFVKLTTAPGRTATHKIVKQ